MLRAMKLALVELMRRVVDEDRTATSAVDRIAHGIEVALLIAILGSRKRARLLAHAGLRAQLDAIGKIVGEAFLFPAPVANATDIVAARRAAKFLSKRAAKVGRRALLDDPTLTRRQAVRTVDAGIAGAVGGVGSYVASEAFASERSAELKKTKARSTMMIPHTIFVREWSADMDRRTCPRCAQLNGAIAMPFESFPEGDPPVHGNCRCTDYLIPMVLLYPRQIQDLERSG